MTRVWFKLNKWKTGWVPVAWQGWTITVIYITLTVYNFVRLAKAFHSTSDLLLNFIPQTILFTGLLSVLCYLTSDNSAGKNMLK